MFLVAGKLEQQGQGLRIALNCLPSGRVLDPVQVFRDDLHGSRPKLCSAVNAGEGEELSSVADGQLVQQALLADRTKSLNVVLRVDGKLQMTSRNNDFNSFQRFDRKFKPGCPKLSSSVGKFWAKCLH